MKLDLETKWYVIHIIEEDIFNPRKRTIDISKCIDPEDNKLDLWLLESSIRYSLLFMEHVLGRKVKFNSIIGIEEYCNIRNLELSEYLNSEEFIVIYRFIDQIIDDQINQ